MSELTTSNVQIQNGELKIDAYLAQPTTNELCPAVIVVQEIFGVNAHIREVTERVAALGYVAIAPAIYQRIAPGFETGYAPEDIKLGRQYKVQTKASELLSDLQATVDYLYALPQVQQKGIGLIGFCFGGHVAYLGATLDAVKATASFYGAGIANWCPGEEEPTTIDRTADIDGEIYCFFGKEDTSIPMEQVKQIEAALQNNNIKHQIFIYDNAGHGFCCDRRASYEPTAAADAWEKACRLFEHVLSDDK
ncbi:dienelactone hydrolase family protein [[Leptolyngbya] sp. PCC 7376]|uniref:dienelactone hydrolase family protein n=1 Tax=[Leptolyngbya] sp. PCC 7376 TaxID=111781 RepID=UPI00029ECBC6|nr:dienelactone hydrolase family protein [[Leptolyngbya] sp. PCC 7376]AFY38046.1 dienelactone hydrolase family protein [[Leptolyngbya] sp. PCC 7376]